MSRLLCGLPRHCELSPEQSQYNLDRIKQSNGFPIMFPSTKELQLGQKTLIRISFSERVEACRIEAEQNWRLHFRYVLSFAS